jgi:hypothetical protein
MFCGLTFDMRGAQKAQPFGHPLDGRVRCHCGLGLGVLPSWQMPKLGLSGATHLELPLGLRHVLAIKRMDLRAKYGCRFVLNAKNLR